MGKDGGKRPRPNWGIFSKQQGPKRYNCKPPPTRTLSAGDFSEGEIQKMEHDYNCSVIRPTRTRDLVRVDQAHVGHASSP